MEVTVDNLTKNCKLNNGRTAVASNLHFVRPFLGLRKVYFPNVLETTDTC